MLRIYHYSTCVFNRTKASNDSRLLEHTVVHSILLSYCDSFNLSLLADKAPKEDWQSIGGQPVGLANLVSDYGRLNEDVWPENCIVTGTATDSGAKYKLFLIDFAMSRIRKQGESDQETERERWAT